MDRKSGKNLVEEIKSGNIGAFETLVRRYERKLWWWVAQMIGDDMAAEEIVQDVFFNIYKTIERVDTSRKFSTYLFGVARNGAISYLRKKKREISLTDDVATTEMGYYENPEVLDKLPAKYQQAVKMYYLDELTYKEIAAKLKLPVNTVRTHLRRGKEVLRKIWKI